MKLNNSIISKLEDLSMLKLSDDERDEILLELEKLIDMIYIIQKVDVQNDDSFLENSSKQFLREDIIRKALDTDQVFLNTSNREGDYFAVPKVIKRDNE